LFVAICVPAILAQCQGACQDTSAPCPGDYQPNLCPGPSNIQCCPEPTPNCPGQCQDNSLPCSGVYQSGLCPGPDSVQCCKSGTGGACATFAEQQWNCADPQCSQTVPEGSAQPGYQCAEFVSRTLAAAGHINLDPLAAQSAYGSYQWNGQTYDLLWVSSQQGGPLGLEDFLKVIGWQNVGADPGSVVDCSALMVNGAEGAYSHTCVGVGPDVVDAHNMARHQKSGSFYTINTIWNPPSWAREHNATAIARIRETPRRHIKFPPRTRAGVTPPNPKPSN